MSSEYCLSTALLAGNENVDAYLITARPLGFNIIRCYFHTLGLCTSQLSRLDKQYANSCLSLFH